MWISVDDRLPEPRRRVYVKGLYVPEGTGYPLSSRVESAPWKGWSSSEWRGIVSVTHWWDENL
jgi:hypothetical protein